MTATTKPSGRKTSTRPRSIRFNSMESLGFSDSTFTWSDNPAQLIPMTPIVETTPVDPLAGWEPTEFGGRRYDGSNFRWSLLIVFVAVLGAVAAFAYWLYQRPAAEATATAAALEVTAADLGGSLQSLETFNASLPDPAPAVDSSDLFAVDAAARALFGASTGMEDDATVARSSAAAAASSALDAVRLAGDTHAYKLAVAPLLAVPTLTTDPGLVGLDDAARTFGDWQLRFDETRTALPDDVLAEVTTQLDVLSGDLAGILTDYVDALRSDDESAVVSVLATLDSRLSDIDALLWASISDVQDRVSTRIAETRTSLTSLAG